MKTCRFCLNQQENGAFCEACGSPLESDVLDFSQNQFPDPTMSAATTVVASVGNAATPALENVATPALENNAAPASANTTTTQPAFAPAPAQTAEDATKQVVFQPTTQTGIPVVNKTVMYSAKQSGETVYLKKKGSYKPSGAEVVWPSQNVNANVAGMPNTAPNLGVAGMAGPAGAAAPGGQNAATPKEQSEYEKIRTFSLVLSIINGIGLITCFGTSIISFIISLSSFLKINKVVNGKSSDPQADSKSANLFNWIALVLCVSRILFWIIVLTSD